MRCSLRQLLSSVVVPETVIAYICREVLVSLGSLHAARIMHRDVCSGNILISTDVTSIQGTVKLCDFGYSLLFPSGREKSSTVIGSPYYMAPEVSTGAKYDYKADIWALGITALEMAEGIPPLANQNPVRALFLAASITPPSLQSPTSWTAAFTEFLSLCLQKSPGKRASSGVLLSHAFVADGGTGRVELVRALERVRE